MSTVLIVLGIWAGVGGVVLLPICALLKANRERIEAETEPAPEYEPMGYMGHSTHLVWDTPSRGKEHFYTAVYRRKP